jgi:hypothetical protein
MYVRVFQVVLMAFVTATCYINVGKSTLDDGEWGVRAGRMKNGPQAVHREGLGACLGGTRGARR